MKGDSLLRRLPIICLAVLAFGCAATKPAQSITLQSAAAGDDTAAIQQALDAISAKGGGELVLPAGPFTAGSIQLHSHTTLHLAQGAVLRGSVNAADYPLMKIRWEGRWRPGHRALIFAENAVDVAIIGPGKIIGAAPPGHLRNPRGPCLIEFINCRNIRLDGFSTEYERMWAIHPTLCTEVSIHNLTIRSKLPNGDGIDVDSCSNVTITDCDIDTGDDAIALKSGRGTEGYTLARPTQDVTVSNCTLGSGFAGLAIGTEMSGGVRNVRVDHTTFTRGANSIYIKSRIGRGGLIENIRGHDLVARASCFLRIDLLNHGIQDEQPVQGDAGAGSTWRTFSMPCCATFGSPITTTFPSARPWRRRNR